MAALVRKLREETCVDLHGAESEVLWTAYVNDPHNTDWAWAATAVAPFHLDREVTATAGSDVLDARWWSADNLDQLSAAITKTGGVLYLAHEALLTLALNVAW
ncbi:hypothetical protein [Frankia sp. EAN1pec]|uniref:hypothetical protein n=1 Tax=Parafrankia sp. (strain EAN1pec) TaxID=298653 RepID=UPI000318D9CD